MSVSNRERTTGNTEVGWPWIYLPIIVATTESQRALPQKFRRFFINIEPPRPSTDQLALIGKSHFPSADDDLIRAVIALFDKNKYPTELFLDFLQAALQLQVTVNSQEWDQLVKTIIVPTQDSGTGVLGAFLCHSSIGKAAVRDLRLQLNEVWFEPWLSAFRRASTRSP